jgi:signal transduction histidine kinase
MAAERVPLWRRLASVRARTTAAATVIVGIAVVLSALALVVLLRRSLVKNVDDIAEIRAQDIAALARQDVLPRRLATAGDEGSVVQVVDTRGAVVAGTPGLETRPPIASFQPGGSDPVSRTVEQPTFASGREVRVLALDVTGGDRPVTIYVATNLEAVEETLDALKRALGLGVPPLLAVIGLTAWVVVGRALRPVEAIRFEVADVSERSLDRRVPVPATHDEISRLATTMNTMLERLESAAERQRRFVADASHELQTPLASARTDLEVALAHPDRADWQTTATDLLKANQRMERLAHDLLYLARVDATGLRRASSPVDLDDVVLIEAARVRDRGQTVIDTSGVSAAAVQGRREDLARAVRNLLDNADRYAASAVRVELHSDDGEAVLVVADDGPGIAVADRDRIFERFTRLDDARSRSTGGTGLGLAITGEIVAAHGGSIRLDGAPGGARFVVRLPALAL